MQDPLNLVHLFSKLPTNPVPGRATVESETITECARLITEWKLWAIKTHSLRKMFLGIKGIYYECDVPGHKGEMIRVRWLEAYDFQQHVPTDVDFRILLTFIELYRTLLSFVLYRLYTEENLVYPPPLDEELEKKGETVGAFKLVEKSNTEGVTGTISKKEVKRAIRGIRSNGATVEDEEEDVEMDGEEDKDEDFVERPAKTEESNVQSAPLTTYNSIVASSSTSKPTLLFAPYTFFVSRETSPKTWEFVIRAMGGKAITSLQATSPELAKEADQITHVVVDRPMTKERMAEMQGDRKWLWVQPQWVADCINKGKIVDADAYKPGVEQLPSHLSPWEGEGEAERPWLEATEAGVAPEGEAVEAGSEVDSDVDVDAEEDDEEEESESESDAKMTSYPPALLAASLDPSNKTLLHAAELEAETSGTPHAQFIAHLKEATKANKSSAPAKNGGKKEDDAELRKKIMMTNKKQRLYEKMKYSNAQKSDEVCFPSLTYGLS
jgi:pescadillo protein